MKIEGNLTLDTGRTFTYEGWIKQYGIKGRNYLTISHIDLHDETGRIIRYRYLPKGEKRQYSNGSMTCLGLPLVSFYIDHWLLHLTEVEDRQLKELMEKN